MATTDKQPETQRPRIPQKRERAHVFRDEDTLNKLFEEGWIIEAVHRLDTCTLIILWTQN